MDNSIIAQRIKLYRQLAKMTQEDLAEAAEVSETYIRKMEAGDRTPSLEMVMTLAEALNTTPDHLLLPAAQLSNSTSDGILDLLKDCTSAEFAVLYENLANLKRLLRRHVK